MNALYRSRVEPELERTFQRSYYERICPTLRVLSLLLCVMFTAYMCRDYLETEDVVQSLSISGAPAIFFAFVFILTWMRGFEAFWQPCIVIGGLLTCLISIESMGVSVATRHAERMLNASDFPINSLFFGQHMRLLIVCLGVLRLQFKWAVLLQLGILMGSFWVLSSTLIITPLSSNDISFFLRPTVAVLTAVLLASWVEEQLARSAFNANYQLERERNKERLKREQTEAKLQILSQALGSIVHDIGGPLSIVKLGSENLDLFLDDEVLERKKLREFVGSIQDGGEMLNYLRLSLIEQIRVIEGRATQVYQQEVSLCELVEAGAHYQKPHTIGERQIELSSEDVRVFVDPMKMITVFMNLIGNALKYSDGGVKVIWCQEPDSSNEQLLIAVLDHGTQGRGVTQEEAKQLFRAFGRLENHAAIEGTGLGLLSVQKIIEAQGGEVFIQGYQDGTPQSAVFSSNRGYSPTLLHGSFRTAFIVTVPLVVEPDIEA